MAPRLISTCARCGSHMGEVNFCHGAGAWLCLDCAEPHLPSVPMPVEPPARRELSSPFERPLDRVLTGLRFHCLAGADVAEILGEEPLEPYRQGEAPNTWVARCPFHPEAGFTLRIGELPDGEVRLLCRVGCPERLIRRALIPDPDFEALAKERAEALIWAQRVRRERSPA